VIGLDTNVLVRYIAQDDRKQAGQAASLIESSCSAEQPGWIDTVVLCELVWVLESAYGYTRPVVANVVRQILGTAELCVDQPDVAWTALRAYENNTADFADYLIGQRNQGVGCETTYTFDKRAALSHWHTSVP